MKNTFPIEEQPLPKNLPAKFAPVEWRDWGNSIVCRAHGRLVKFWPMDRVVQSLPTGR